MLKFTITLKNNGAGCSFKTQNFCSRPIDVDEFEREGGFLNLKQPGKDGFVSISTDAIEFVEVEGVL